MSVTTYFIAATYMINGHKNVHGMAIADEINSRLMSADQTEGRRAYESELEDIDADLFGLFIVESTSEPDDE